MYAVVSTGGKQIRVEEGDVVRVEKLDAPVGASVELNEVCMLSKDEGIVTDAEALSEAKVLAEVTQQGRGNRTAPGRG